MPLSLIAATRCLAALLAPPDSLPPLQGVWQGNVHGHRYVEQWTCRNAQCDGQAMAYAGDTVVQTEIMRITHFAGRWHFLAWLEDGPAVAFTRIPSSAGTWTFENKQNDFPHTVSYTLSHDSLKAYIEGPGTDGNLRLDFHLAKVAK